MYILDNQKNNYVAIDQNITLRLVYIVDFINHQTKTNQTEQIQIWCTNQQIKWKKKGEKEDNKPVIRVV